MTRWRFHNLVKQAAALLIQLSDQMLALLADGLAVLVRIFKEKSPHIVFDWWLFCLLARAIDFRIVHVELSLPRRDSVSIDMTTELPAVDNACLRPLLKRY